MQRLAVVFAALAVLLASATADQPSDSCAAEPGRACEPSATQRQKVAKALAADGQGSREEPPLELLQRSAEGVDKAAMSPRHDLHLGNNASRRESLTAATVLWAQQLQKSEAKQKRRRERAHGRHTAKQVAALERAIRALEAAHANRSRTAKRANYTRGKGCSAYTGGTCFLTGQCAETRQAECQSASMCVCPDYTCDNNGRCELSPSEIANAVANGVSDVAEKVTSVCSVVPGLADSVSGITATLSGISDTLGGIIGSLTGADMNSCNSRFVGTCIFSGCDPDLGYTVSCDYGSCQCKEGFCAMDGRCTVDIAGLVASAFAD